MKIIQFLKQWFINLFLFRHYNSVDISATWHVCDHDFECKMASKDYQEFECKKCHVSATNRFANRIIIMVNSRTNVPFYFEPWGIANKELQSISYQRNN